MDSTGNGTNEWDRATVILPLDRGPNDPARLEIAWDVLTSELGGGVPDPVTLSVDALAPPFDVMVSIGGANGDYEPVTAFGSGPITGPDGSSFVDGRLGFSLLRRRVDIGPHAIVLDVADEYDGQFDTALLVDTVKLPEPGGLVGLGAGAALLGLLARRRERGTNGDVRSIEARTTDAQ